MMTATRPLTRPAAGVCTFEFTDIDVSELAALTMHFYEIGRPSLASETFELTERIKGALSAHGACDSQLFTFGDYSRLMGRLKFAAQVSNGLAAAVQSIAERIWCGLTGDETCPIRSVERRRDAR